MKQQMLRQVMTILGYLLAGLFLFASPAWGNGVKLDGIVKVVNVSGSVATVRLTLKWNNSWRDSYNWDAVWVFLKYKKNDGWQQVNLNETGHILTSGDANHYTFLPGKTGSNVVGLFILRDANGAGSNTVTCDLQWTFPSGIRKLDFDNNDAFIMAQGVEMVYIPYGAYSLGDGSSAQSFCTAEGHPVTVDSEKSRSLCTLTSPSVPSAPLPALPVGYPKGYSGFYAMKYEVSQEQFTTFLNLLIPSEQQQLLPQLSSLKAGEYLFGSPERPSCRNGIVVSQKPSGKPVIFDCNLTPGDEYGQVDDGQTVACNYLSVNDALAYCAWAGLRPISEMEYEKACRKPYPDAPLAGEYAWNDASAPVFASGTTENFTDKEKPTAGNVNAANLLGGPLRCGSFAAMFPGQKPSGASYWGVMELCGNLKEITAIVTNTTISGATHGAGAYNLSLWGTTPNGFGYRGGGYTSTATALRTSDRSEVTPFISAGASALAQRDSTVGFRGVRSFSTAGSGVTVNPGTIALEGTIVCPGREAVINSTLDASVAGMSGLPISYIWYVNDAVQAGASATFTFTPSNAGSYTIKRKAVCALGEAETLVLTVTVFNANMTFNPVTSAIDACDYAPQITVMPAVSTPAATYRWTYNAKELSTTNTYTPGRGDFDNSSVSYTVSCTMTQNGCLVTKSVQVEVPKEIEFNSDVMTFDQCGATMIDTRDQKRYCTVKVGNQCWMAKNLNYGTFTEINSNDYWSFDKSGVQKWCIGGESNNSYISNEANCTTYGGLYEWWEVVCNGQCNSNVTPTNAQSLNLSSESELTTYGVSVVSGKVQGICPNGWHIPTDTEWTTLGRVAAGWNMQKGGARYSNGAGFYYMGVWGHWWSSTPSWYRYLNNAEVGANFNRTSGSLSYGHSVRCLKN